MLGLDAITLGTWMPPLAIVLGLIGLVWSSDAFVDAAVGIASKLGVSPYIIGMTIVAFGTSAPEVLVSVMAAYEGTPSLAIGNAIGSNIANIALVLGVTVLITPLYFADNLKSRELPILLIVTLIAGALLMNGVFDRFDAAILALTGACIGFGFIISSKKAKNQLAVEASTPTPSVQVDVEKEVSAEAPSNGTVLLFILSLSVLLVSAKSLVWGATVVATQLGVSDVIIGLTIIAIGTSLPELAASIASCLKKQGDLALGNIIGSNVMNLLVVLPWPGLLAPGVIESEIFSRDFTVMFGVTALLAAMAYWPNKKSGLNRVQGALLLVIYCVYLGILAQQAVQ